MRDTVYVYVGDYGEYAIAHDVRGFLGTDRRTKKGKLYHKYLEALEVLTKVAWEMEVRPQTITPR